MKSGNKGFTLIEVIIAIALLAIMTVAIAPVVIQITKVSQADKDTQIIGLDLKQWNKNRLSPPDMPEGVLVPFSVSFDIQTDLLVSGAKLTSELPDFSQGVKGASDWSKTNKVAPLEDFDTLLDPWGNPYMVNLRGLKFGHEMSNVMVLSAGPNEIIETPFTTIASDSVPGGDDIAYVFRPGKEHIKASN